MSITTPHYINGRENIKRNYKLIPDTSIRFCELDASQRIGMYLVINAHFQRNYILNIISNHLTDEEYFYVVDSLTYILNNAVELKGHPNPQDNVFNSSNQFKGLDADRLLQIFPQEKLFKMFSQVLEYEMNSSQTRRSLKHRENLSHMCLALMRNFHKTEETLGDLYTKVDTLVYTGMDHSLYHYYATGELTEKTIQEYRDFFTEFRVPLEKTLFVADGQTYTKEDLAFLQSQNIPYLIKVGHTKLFDHATTKIFDDPDSFIQYANNQLTKEVTIKLNDYLTSPDSPSTYSRASQPNFQARAEKNLEQITQDLAKKELSIDDQLENPLKLIYLLNCNYINIDHYRNALLCYQDYIIANRKLKPKSPHAKYVNEVMRDGQLRYELSDLALDHLEFYERKVSYLISNDTNLRHDNLINSWYRREFHRKYLEAAQKDLLGTLRNSPGEFRGNVQFVFNIMVTIIYVLLEFDIHNPNPNSETEQYRQELLDRGIDIYSVIKRLNKIFMYFKTPSCLFHPSEGQFKLLNLLRVNYPSLIPFIYESPGIKAMHEDSVLRGEEDDNISFADNNSAVLGFNQNHHQLNISPEELAAANADSGNNNYSNDSDE